MLGKKRPGFLFSGALLALSFLSFSDTARAQSVTVDKSVLNFSGPANAILNSCNGGSDCKVHVTGSGVSTVQIQVSAAASAWLNVGPPAQNLPADFTVSVNTNALPAGTTTGTFDIFSSSNNAIRQTVTVNVNVTSSSQLSATPTAITFDAQVGATFGIPESGTCPIQNSPASCQITVQTTSATPIAYFISFSTQDGKQWLQPGAASGSTDGSPFNIAVNPSILGNNPGVYHGAITIQS